MLLRTNPSVLVANRVEPGQQQRFETVLAEIAQRRGGDGEHVIALMFEGQRTDDLAAELGEPLGATSLVRRLRGGQHRDHVDTGLPPDLEGAGVDNMGGRRTLRPITTLEHDGAEAELRA